MDPRAPTPTKAPRHGLVAGAVVGVRQRMVGNSDTTHNEKKRSAAMARALQLAREELKNERIFRKFYQDLATERLLRVIELENSSQKRQM